MGAYSNVSGLIVIGNCQLQNKEIVRGLGYIYETYPSSTVVRYPNQRNSPLAITRMFNRKNKKNTIKDRSNEVDCIFKFCGDRDLPQQSKSHICLSINEQMLMAGKWA